MGNDMAMITKRILFPGIVLLLAVGFFSGFFLSGWSNGRKMGNISFEKRMNESSTTLTNPLLECGNMPEEFLLGETKRIKAAVEAKIGTEIGSANVEHVSVYFRDLHNGSTFGINEKEKFTPASLLKVPIAITYYKIAEEDPGLLKKEFTYRGVENSDFAVPNFKPEISLEEGKTYSIEEMIAIMIKYSDNDASRVLSGNMSEEDFFRVYTDFGIDISTMEQRENYMTVKDYAAFFRILYNSSYLKREFSEKVLGLLSEISFKDGLVSGVPSGIKVSHKFGERVMGNLVQLHDCGIVYYPNHPYLLCVMTRGSDFGRLKSTVAGISREVYAQVYKINEK